MMRDLIRPDEPKATLERYDIRELLGEGGSASVHRAVDRALGREVALKVLRDTYDPNLRQRFLREGQVIASLVHPNLVKVYDVGEDQGRLFLVMELVKGRPLRRTELKKDMESLAKVARAVQRAHEAGVIHRDLKPSNVLVTTEGEPKVVDFGLARRENSTSMTKSGSVMGTLVYMAPEQARGEGEISVRTDVYSLGAILYELLGGRPPHVAGTDAELLNRVLHQEPVALDASLPEELVTVCLHAMEKSPARRYATASEMAADLERWLRGEPVVATRPSAARKAGSYLVRRASVAVAVAAAIVIAVLLGQRWSADARERAGREAGQRTQERVRLHLEAGRSLVRDLDRLLMTSDWTQASRRALANRARAEFAIVLEAAPGDAEALLGTARAYKLDENLAQAAKYCTQSIAAAPEFVAARLERLLLNVERYEEFRHKANGDVSPATPEALAVRQEIVEDLAVIRAASHEKRELQFAEGMIAFADGDYAVAAPILREYAEAAVTDARGFLWSGHAWYHAHGHEEETIDALTRALKLRPRDAWALRLRGVCRQRMGEDKAAIPDFDAALEIEPDRAQTLEDRGHSRIHEGDFDGAIDDLTRALAVAPASWPGRNSAEVTLGHAYFRRGLIRQEGGKIDEAVRDYTDAVRCNDRFAEAYANRGSILLVRKEYDRSIADFERALEMGGTSWQYKSMIERRLEGARQAREK
jgi:tetratricopeptide (TPR) repeat protein/predicted Ser/Thr protein kinase